MDEGTANQTSALSTQVADEYGNVTQVKTYPFNNTSAPLKTFDVTFLNTAAYTSNYIRNRPL